MGIKDAAQEIIGAISSVDGIEVNLTAGGADIYWNNLRVEVEPRDLKKALTAIKTLNNLGAGFE